jgi:hypothetical protein
MELIVFLAVRILGSIVFLVFLTIGLVAATWLLPLFFSLGVLGAFLCLCTHLEDDHSPTAQLGRDSLRYALGVMACIVVISFVVIGIATLLGGATMVLTGVIGLAYLGYRGLWRGPARSAGQATEDKPASAEFCSMDRDCAGHGVTDRGRTDNHPAEATDTVSRRSLPADPAAVSTDELCRAWRVSYLLLQEARTLEARTDRSTSSPLPRRVRPSLPGGVPAMAPRRCARRRRPVPLHSGPVRSIARERH